MYANIYCIDGDDRMGPEFKTKKTKKGFDYGECFASQ